MSRTDRDRWDTRHAAEGAAPLDPDPSPPPHLAEVSHLIPARGTALELACGRGQIAVWLAWRGLDYWGVDVSPVAIELATELARRSGVAERCRFDVWDLDRGLPPGPKVDMILCHLFFDPALTDAIVDRLNPGAVLALVTLSEVGQGPGRFRSRPGQLLSSFAELDVLDHEEKDGVARLVARRP